MNYLVFWSFLVLICAISYKFMKLQKHGKRKIRDFLHEKDNSGTDTPIVIAHRGGQFEAPENTLAAIKTAKRNGATAVEVDLAFTEDGYPVIIHDETVDRTTNGTGDVSSTRFYEIRKLDASHKKKKLRYEGGKTEEVGFEQIPTLKEVALLCKELGMKIILDVKSDPTATANKVSSLAKEISGLENLMLIASFYPPVIYMAKRKCPEFLTALIWRYDYCNLTINGKRRFTGIMYYLMYIVDVIGNISVHSWLSDFLGFDAVLMNKDHLSWRYISEWRSKDIDVISWTVNNPLEKNFHLKNLKIPIITDSLLNAEDCPEQEF